MKILLLFITPIIIFSQQKSSPKLAEYEGYYLLSSGFSISSSDYLQLDIVRAEDTSKFVVRVHFFTDTLSNTLDEDVICNVEIIKIIGDSLYFRSKKCSNERYEFSGRFLVPSQELGTRDENVLEGVLIHFVKDRLVRKRQVTFEYSVGC
jgi:hypothetical protein